MPALTSITEYDQFIIDAVDHIESLGITYSANPSTYTHTKTGRSITRTPVMDAMTWYTLMYEFCNIIEYETKKDA